MSRCTGRCSCEGTASDTLGLVRSEMDSSLNISCLLPASGLHIAWFLSKIGAIRLLTKHQRDELVRRRSCALDIGRRRACGKCILFIDICPLGIARCATCLPSPALVQASPQ